MTGQKIAEKRADKNGKVVTRYVNAPGAATAKPMPPPALAIPLSTGMTTVPSEVNGLDDLWRANAISQSEYTLDDFDPRAVKEVDRLLATSERKFALSEAVQTELNLMVECGSTKGFNNIAVFGKHVVPHRHSDVNTYMEGLHTMGFPSKDYLLDSTDDERASATALVSFIARAENLHNSEKVVVYGQHDDQTSLANHELASFIFANPEAADDVLDILSSSRDVPSVDLIKSMLDHEQKAFRDGVL